MPVIILKNDLSRFLRLFFNMCVVMLIIGCSSAEPVLMEDKYDSAIKHMDKEDYSLAIPLFKELIEENPGTRFAAYAYLKVADAYLLSGESRNFTEAETNYRIFLNYNSYSHLVPYVLSRLIELNYKRNTSLIFGDSYAFTRDSEHFKKIINEYQRFYFLYPDSLYLKDAGEYLGKSVDALAEHESRIGQWYYHQSLFTAAISRFRYILNNYPNYLKRETVVEMLIDAYRKNQQPELANELQSIFNLSKTASGT
ncbi:MAG: outer membrane protein assembly factor BamD [Deltaproteobacteria bacterium]|jgi:outer membrane protein assembly factor BamD|nr:outer membrane protein assembly factor BamD [Deltaproteobacteria bacterium]MBT4089847.1 outer membrane protein assembly factor BamD [Deltaproteobacteria bacterium]MBT4266298.1 outer membrane protein assembly factor BamD [Deltaproteobacteria bacterium]MBT4640008.1 outer membrane protein assembly factor BamD [Deltaproteobacteria bacterium]MBT6503101.1 outer membrane protein assembly factor BamD [Deltaproteobacteria bacterium]